MPNRKHLYYIPDAPTFRGVFRIDGVAQTPDADSCTIKIMNKDDNDNVVFSGAGVISGTELQYQYTTTIAGTFAIFMTATYNSGADIRTGVIEFIVMEKKAY